MRRQGHLFEEVVAFDSLCRSARRAAKGKAVSQASAAFLLDLERNVLQLERDLRAGSYRPGPFRTFPIRDPKPRTIAAAPFRDRVVHHSLCAALEPRLERYGVFDSYACRKGKGSTAALKRAQHFARRLPRYLKLDVQHFFERIRHDVLLALLARLFKDRQVLRLAEVFVRHTPPGGEAGRGLPIGNLTSQHFANLYLGPLDHFIKETLRVRGYLRYMDDLLLFDHERTELRRIKQQIEAFLADHLGLELRAEATCAGPVRCGVPFLGFRLWPAMVRFDKGSRRRFARQLSRCHGGWRDGSMREEEAAARAASLVGWAEFGATRELRRSLLRRLRACGTCRTVAHGLRAPTG